MDRRDMKPEDAKSTLLMDRRDMKPEDAKSTLLFCRMCQALYRKPKLLSCLHSFCTSCLQYVVKRSSEGAEIVCFICLNPTKLADTDGVSGLTDNSLLHRLCEDYIAEIKNHLVATSGGQKRTESAASSSKSSPLSRNNDSEEAETSQPAETGSSISSSSTSQDASVETDASKLPNEETPGKDKTQAPGRPGSAPPSKIQAIENNGQLKTKTIILQGEALRVTSAIDNVNQYMAEWHRRKNELIQAVQRRSNQLQLSIKRTERNIISQIDNKATDDQLYSDLDKAKQSLRSCLKSVLHQINVLKLLQEMGSDDEINYMSSTMVQPCMWLKEVVVPTVDFQLDTKSKATDDIISRSFGDLVKITQDLKMFTPSFGDFMDISNEKTWPSETSQDQNLLMVNEGAAHPPKSPNGSRRNSTTSLYDAPNDLRLRRHDSELSLATIDQNPNLTQFQTARESFRNQRREILRQGQRHREDVSPLRADARRRHWGAPGAGRHSYDMASPPSMRKSALSSYDVNAHRPTTVTGGVEPRNSAEGASNPQPEEARVGFQFGVGASHHVHGVPKPDDVGMPSPVVEEGSVPSSPQKHAFRSIQPGDDKALNSSPEEAAGLDVTISYDKAQAHRQQHQTSPAGSNSASRKTSLNRTPLTSPSEECPPDMDWDKETNRYVRKAISHCSDKKSKIEFLRENWQKRKEILIQSQGFVSSDKTSPKPSSPGRKISPTEWPARKTSVDNALSSPKPNRPDSIQMSTEPAKSLTSPTSPKREVSTYTISEAAEITGATDKKEEKSRQEPRPSLDRHERSTDVSGSSESAETKTETSTQSPKASNQQSGYCSLRYSSWRQYGTSSTTEQKSEPENKTPSQTSSESATTTAIKPTKDAAASTTTIAAAATTTASTITQTVSPTTTTPPPRASSSRRQVRSERIDIEKLLSSISCGNRFALSDSSESEKDEDKKETEQPAPNGTAKDETGGRQNQTQTDKDKSPSKTESASTPTVAREQNKPEVRSSTDDTTYNNNKTETTRTTSPISDAKMDRTNLSGNSLANLSNQQPRSQPGMKSPITSAKTAIENGSRSPGLTRHNVTFQRPADKSSETATTTAPTTTGLGSESRRRRVDLSSRPQGFNRRHTVDISKTIPQGMTVSDLIRRESVDAAKDNVQLVVTSSTPESESRQDLHKIVYETFPLLGSNFGMSGCDSSTDLTVKAPDVISDRGGTKVVPERRVSQSVFLSSTQLSPQTTSPPLMRANPVGGQGQQQAATSGALSGKLRNLARRKKERWRHLTIH